MGAGSEGELVLISPKSPHAVVHLVVFLFVKLFQLILFSASV